MLLNNINQSRIMEPEKTKNNIIENSEESMKENGKKSHGIGEGVYNACKKWESLSNVVKNANGECRVKIIVETARASVEIIRQFQLRYQELNNNNKENPKLKKIYEKALEVASFESYEKQEAIALMLLCHQLSTYAASVANF